MIEKRHRHRTRAWGARLSDRLEHSTVPAPSWTLRAGAGRWCRCAAEVMPTQRGVHLRCIAERDRMCWQKASGYNRRALVEADIARWKRVIDDGPRSQTDGRQATKVAIAAGALNRMLELGRPEYVRVA